jgi:hypothetical protein
MVSTEFSVLLRLFQAAKLLAVYYTVSDWIGWVSGEFYWLACLLWSFGWTGSASVSATFYGCRGKQCVMQFIKFPALVRVVSVLTRNIPRMAGRRLIHVSTLSFGDVLNL